MPLSSSPRKDEAGMTTTIVARPCYHAGILACVLKTRGSDHRVSGPSPHARCRLAVNRVLRNISCQTIHSESRSIHLNLEQSHPHALGTAEMSQPVAADCLAREVCRT
jgi:hypothetical protein